MLKIGDIMSNAKSNIKSEILAKQNLERFKGPKLVITPKKELLQWYNHTKTILKGIDNDMLQIDCNIIDCPNCKSKLDNFSMDNTPGELWYVCYKCDLTFSHTQYIFFTTMIIRAINNELSDSKIQ